ncbi:melanoma-associated antigen B10-like [Suncus etruscus]|uniref:melanoma-associated antigen B10-like n=1 Tax=Suncus etruscus TaxID=109475 RepID=UPI002110A29B|nr:melanoma-associated antigen B10-like [Suncus etruscus]
MPISKDIKIEAENEEKVGIKMEPQKWEEVKKSEEELKDEKKKKKSKKHLIPVVRFLNLSSSAVSSSTSSVIQLDSDAGERSVHRSIDSSSIVSVESKVECLVKFLLFKYQSKESIITEEEMLVMLGGGSEQFPVIFKRASKYLEVICGIDIKELDPSIPSYVIFNSLNFTCDRMPRGSGHIPRSGLLVIVLGVIFMEGNCAREEAMWDSLNVIGIESGISHFLYGDPRKLLTRDLVQENYLEYRQVPNSDPLCYEFLWGPRACAEISKLDVMQFLLKIKMTEPSTFLFWSNKALREEEKKKTAGPSDSATAM